MHDRIRIDETFLGWILPQGVPLGDPHRRIAEADVRTAAQHVQLMWLGAQSCDQAPPNKSGRARNRDIHIDPVCSTASCAKLSRTRRAAAGPITFASASSDACRTISRLPKLFSSFCTVLSPTPGI